MVSKGILNLLSQKGLQVGTAGFRSLSLFWGLLELLGGASGYEWPRFRVV